MENLVVEERKALRVPNGKIGTRLMIEGYSMLLCSAPERDLFEVGQVVLLVSCERQQPAVLRLKWPAEAVIKAYL